MPIIDSSTIISLVKIQRNDLLLLLKKKVVTIQEVYEECVQKGIHLGYPDALRIKNMFDEKIITIKHLKTYKTFSGVSSIDSKVISLAKREKDDLLVDDVKLGRRAKAECIKVKNTPDILLYFMKTKKISNKEFMSLLQKLVYHKRLSIKTKRLYEKTGGL